MKILNICGYSWDIGGPPKIIYDHAIVQMSMGAEVTILTPISEGQKIYAIPEGAKVVTCKRHWFAKFWAEFSPELYSWIKQHGNEYDIIHIHGVWHFAGVAPYLAGITTAKCITTHGLLDRWTISKGYWKKYLFGLLFQKSILKKTELIQINNTDEQEDLKRFLGFQHSNVKIIPNGMNLSNFAKLPSKGLFREKFNLPTDKKIILFLSRINLKKGLDLLLPAFKTVANKREDCLLVMAGPDDGYLTETQNFIAENNLQNRIKLVGMLTGDDKLAAFADADIFALPSHSEGFSIATLEALISGIPSLLSDRVGFGEAIKETNAAYVVELNTESIVAGLYKMLDDELYCQKIAKNGVSLVKDRYDIELVARQLYTEFEKIARK
ncbi:glycosyltransferase involved in cell wall biosynthesis [Arcicella aurantiaca]|uniref:Glycosyltransferase involved in cell wall biosynthesis n=1 Tax=Arcicella aurantiaca TaxID=591202 RepID=A0A316ETK6_9BACT|nr:glycosyltransferase [Arcicella aurantiaca]PWK26510.1 glycosyltransferase involved in cell wall biosynthesis [Arcicella aurantiaca]